MFSSHFSCLIILFTFNTIFFNSLNTGFSNLLLVLQSILCRYHLHLNALGMLVRIQGKFVGRLTLVPDHEFNHIYIYIYVYMCVCVCVCKKPNLKPIWLGHNECSLIITFRSISDFTWLVHDQSVTVYTVWISTCHKLNCIYVSHSAVGSH